MKHLSISPEKFDLVKSILDKSGFEVIAAPYITPLKMSDFPSPDYPGKVKVEQPRKKPEKTPEEEKEEERSAEEITKHLYGIRNGLDKLMSGLITLRGGGDNLRTVLEPLGEHIFEVGQDVVSAKAYRATELALNNIHTSIEESLKQVFNARQQYQDLGR
jgi:hypothetical protein